MKRASSVAFASIIALSAGACQRESPALLGPPPDTVAADAPQTTSSPVVRRSRLVTFAAADALAVQSSAPDDVRDFRANLFEDVTLDIELRRQAMPGAWSGTVETGRGGEAVVTATATSMFAEIRLNDGRVFRIRPVDAGGTHVVQELDQSRFPAELAPRRAPEEPAPGTLAAADPSMTATTIHVLVAHTEAAKTAAGGDEGIRLQIDLAEHLANIGYANSKINQSIRIVHRTQVSYNDALGYNKALDDLTGKTDGQLDQLHSLRDTHKADQVSLWIANSSACGLAWLMQTQSPVFESRAFSVVSQDCATSNLSFAHELGHNHGAEHDQANSGGQGAYAYCFGRQVPDGSSPYRTIMAYPCQSISCPRQNLWSNPTVSYAGKPSGTATVKNAACLEQTRGTVGGWRN